MGSATVPKIVFGERLIGGLVELNALRKDDNEELERRLTEAGGQGTSAPAYGFDEAEDVEEVAAEEEIGRVVRVLRQRLLIQDRLMKMKIARNCFVGSELVELLVRHHAEEKAKAKDLHPKLLAGMFSSLLLELLVELQLYSLGINPFFRGLAFKKKWQNKRKADLKCLGFRLLKQHEQDNEH